jgi:NADPH:quinone reductase-like Zn-dependent oxidoreductase
MRRAVEQRLRTHGGLVTEAMGTTRALVYDRYGGLEVLSLREVHTPRPQAGEVLVRIRAAALNPKDSLVRKGRFRALSGRGERGFPKRVGVDFAGEVVEVGRGVRDLAPGDRVWGALEEVTYRRGTLATHAAMRAREVGAMPSTLSFEEAAALPLVALTSLQALRDLARLQPGDRVCIHGASGGVGTVAIQLARALGGVVTTTSSARNLELCRSLGAVEALDYAAAGGLDRAFDGSRSFRVVFDAFGDLSFARVRPALAARGIYVSTVPSRRVLFDALRTFVGWPRARLVVVRSRRADLDALRAHVEAGRLRPVIDRVVPFDDAIEAVRYLETKRARGKIVVAIG